MSRIYWSIWILLLIPASVLSQQPIYKLPFEDGSLRHDGEFTVMPYNRLIKSAGKVISFGDTSVENHALDLAILPDKKHIVVEDRYGITIFELQTSRITARWTYAHHDEYKNLLSTYSGITCASVSGKTYIVWSAATRENARSSLMMLGWDGKNLSGVTEFEIPRKMPADLALPNQVIAHVEDDTLYFYVALNGNDQLLKVRFEDKQIMWNVQTGVAPFGLCVTGMKVYVTNWAGPQPGADTFEKAGTPWGLAYTDPATGGTSRGSVAIFDARTGARQNELLVGLHPNAIVSSNDEKLLYVANANSDNISVVDLTSERVIDSISVGLFSQTPGVYGSSPDALCMDPSGEVLYVANGMDNAIAVVSLRRGAGGSSAARNIVLGFIPTEAYPSGIVVQNHRLYVTNLEARGSGVLSLDGEAKKADHRRVMAYTIHKELASVSVIRIPDKQQLDAYTQTVKKFNLAARVLSANRPPRKNIAPRPIPERIGEPSLFKHVVYIIKENKTYDQVFGDMHRANGDGDLCIYGEQITPNQHALADNFVLLDNYYASGKSSAEGHQWSDAAMVSDYVERNVRAWFRSYPHRQADALVYNRKGFIWNDALDHNKKVRIYGEACLTHYDNKMNWLDIYKNYVSGAAFDFFNTSTIARIRPVISKNYPDCDNIVFTDQIRADIFIHDWQEMTGSGRDSLPDLVVMSLPDDHTAGTTENFPTPRAMVADNDLALGRIVEAIAKSPAWDSTVIFVTEDDSQSGWDHVSPYRTVAQVISPYSKLAKTIHTIYNQTSMVRTIEQILGIPPMNVIDASALPMFDCFDSNSQSFVYRHINSKVRLDEMNHPLNQLQGKARFFAKLSKTRAFKELDSGLDDEMNRILWFDAKGDVPYPAKK